MEDLLEQLSQVITLTNIEIELVKSFFKPILLPKGSFWVHQGKVCDQVGFLQTGKLRVHYLEESGQEITCYFFTPGVFISSYTSFLTCTPAVESILRWSRPIYG
ncbi:Crp/Fnr family transcriptional regulator [Dyadobacter crusticola]|uniref:Crp/Fnr family transcriptional regulator n=1 Tax=Dyadobacter crusticola TaxID=292407 RepID=UPI00068C3711